MKTSGILACYKTYKSALSIFLKLHVWLKLSMAHSKCNKFILLRKYFDKTFLGFLNIGLIKILNCCRNDIVILYSSKSYYKNMAEKSVSFDNNGIWSIEVTVPNLPQSVIHGWEILNRTWPISNRSKALLTDWLTAHSTRYFYYAAPLLSPHRCYSAAIQHAIFNIEQCLSIAFPRSGRVAIQ